MLDGIGGWRLGKGGESVAQGCSSSDAKFGKDSMQVTADCARRQEQSLGDLFVRQAGCGQQCDLSLLGGEWRRGVVVDARFGQADGP